MRVITLATPSMLPRARALARSLARHQPDWPFEVVLLGDTSRDGALGAAEVNVRLASELLELDTERLIARHDPEELSVLLLPRLLASYAEMRAGPVVHLPPAVWVLSDLAPIADALATRSVMLAPRTVADMPTDGLEPSYLQLERAGRIDETIIGVDGTPGAEGFLAWWAGHVEETLGSLDGAQPGARPEDRHWLGRYLELAPTRFATAVLDDVGCNLSMWNLHRHRLESSDGRVVVDGGAVARFLHLPGFEPDRPHRLAASASRARVSRSPALRGLLERYAEELREAGWHDAEHRREVGRRLANGMVYDDTLRALYSRALSLGVTLGDPFGGQGTEAFVAWLEGPAPQGAEVGVSRYVYYRVARERPDVLRAYPDLDGGDGSGYVAWCRAFGRDELAIPDRFMPRSHDPSGAHPAPAARSRSRPATPEAHPEQRLAPASSDTGAPRTAVRVTGYLRHSLGLGAAARGYVRALDAAGVPVSTVSVPLHHMTLPAALAAADYGSHGFEDLVHDGRHGFEIVAVNADELPDFVARLGEGYFEGPRIGVWGWETNHIPTRWARAFSLIDEIWVYSRFMVENMGAVAPVPVLALPPPVEAPATDPTPLRLGVPEGFLFLFVFDYLSTIQRKNPIGLIEAFRRAFEPGEGPRLLIKTINAPLRPLADEEVLWAASERDDIHVLDRSLERAELAGLMAACDCYVSLHRAEGFGLTLAEAMAIGKPVIATGYSGNVDFMTDTNSYLVDYEIGRVGPECEIYPPDGEWAEPSLDHAAALMRHVYENPQDAQRVGTCARVDVAEALSPRVTGAAMRARLEELSREGTPSREGTGSREGARLPQGAGSPQSAGSRDGAGSPQGAGSASGGAPPAFNASSHS